MLCYGLKTRLMILTLRLREGLGLHQIAEGGGSGIYKEEMEDGSRYQHSSLTSINTAVQILVQLWLYLCQEIQAVPCAVSSLSFSIFPFLPSFLLLLESVTVPTLKLPQKQTENLEQAQEVSKIESKAFLRTPYCCHSFPSP